MPINLQSQLLYLLPACLVLLLQLFYPPSKLLHLLGRTVDTKILYLVNLSVETAFHLQELLAGPAFTKQPQLDVRLVPVGMDLAARLGWVLAMRGKGGAGFLAEL